MNKSLYIYKYCSSCRTKEKKRKKRNYVNALLISVRVIVNVLKKNQNVVQLHVHTRIIIYCPQ